MDDRRIGASLRALRRRRGMRQVDVASSAGVAQTTVSRLERGHVDALSLRMLRRVFAAVDARLDGEVVWRGGALDHLLDERHAGLVTAAATILRGSGWRVDPEVTFAVFGERGSIDLLAVHDGSGAALVVEAKTELVSLEETLRRHDAKVRLAPRVCHERYGLRPAVVGRLLVLPEASRSRRALAVHAPVLDVALPQRGRAVREWLERPSGALRGLWLLSVSHPRAVGRRPVGVDRVVGR